MGVGGRLGYISRLELGLAIMALVSIAVILVPSERFRTHFELNPSDYSAELVDDVFTGGDSQVRWLDRAAQRWQCQLGRGSSSPYCSVQLNLTDAQGKGIDLSRYDTMTIWGDYRGRADYVRIYLRNRHPNYYDPNNSITTKYNTVEVPVEELATGLELNMEDFTVASWWLVQRNIPLAFSQPEFNEVSLLEIQTGSAVRAGTHEFELQKVVWSGPLIAPTVLYQGVIIAWAVVIFGMLIYRVLNMRTVLNKQQQYQNELLTVNNALNLESRRFEDMAKTDALTGLRNRVGIRDILHQGLINWRDFGTPFSFIIIDLDNFKQINDTYGHDVGDEVLVSAAEIMRNQVRSTDALARWGGEEFVVVCPGATLAQAEQVAENLRREMERSLSCKGQPVTGSCGVASMTEPNLDHLFKKADTALYKAKRMGRNRVHSDRKGEGGGGLIYGHRAQ